MEHIAVELARIAGAEVQSAFGGLLAVKYKDEPREEMTWRDPVSEADHRIEVLIRARLADRFPDHDILGEELIERPGRDHDVVWAIDPIDGTTNFVNGFPLFAASVGVLYRGQPIVGALWCSVSHALRPGVYHTRAACPLYFDGERIEPKPNPAVRRRLAGVPHVAANTRLPWEGRKTGSAAIECAFVAAGMLRVAYFERPNIWDVAGGIALVQAAGGEVWMRGASGWEALERFEPLADAEGGAADLRHWHRAIIVGDHEAVTRLGRVEAG
jgi:myo-inositol-1(or 4)-monophosphatase